MRKGEDVPEKIRFLFISFVNWICLRVATEQGCGHQIFASSALKSEHRQ